MKGMTEDFLLFVVGIFVILIILTTIFGRGIVYNMLGSLAEIEPSYLQDTIRIALTVASYSPGEYEARIKIPLKHIISLNNTFFPSVWVEASQAQFQFSITTPAAFLTECDIVKKCTKTCNLIGEPCGEHTDCCGVLNCAFGTCNSSTCGNNFLDSEEECDDEFDAACPGQCRPDCTCPILHGLIIPSCNDDSDNDHDDMCDFEGCCLNTTYKNQDDCQLNGYQWLSNDTDCADNPNGIEGLPQCSDLINNDDDFFIPGDAFFPQQGAILIDSADPSCHTDHDLSKPYDPNINREFGLEGEPCNNDDDCYKYFLCMSKIKFEKIDETLIIRKFFENNKCKLSIQKG